MTVNKHYRRQLCELFTARHARQSGAFAPDNNRKGGLTALNSGLWLGQAWAVQRLVLRYLAAVPEYVRIVKSSGRLSFHELQASMAASFARADAVPQETQRLPEGAVGRVYRARSLYRSALAESEDGTPFLVNDQSVLYLMAAADEATHGMVVDHRQVVGLSMFGAPNRLQLSIDPLRHQLQVGGGAGGSGSVAKAVYPVFVHYNGGSKNPSWNKGIGFTALGEALRSGWLERRGRRATGEKAKARGVEEEEEEEESMARLFDDHVRVVDNGFRRVDVTWGEVCPLG